MPARDKIHEAVIRALEKRGWRVEREHYKLYLPDRSLFVDLLITDSQTQRQCLVEIKSFDQSSAQTKVLANALGKYLIYRQALTMLEIRVPLLLAVPDSAYYGILDETWLTPLFVDLDIQWLVVDVMAEEVVLWT